MNRKLVYLLLCLIFIVSSTCMAFADEDYLGASDWALAELRMSDNNQLIPNMMKDGFFSFSNEISRIDFCKAVVLFYDKLGGNQDLPTTNPFIDVSDKDVIKAYNAGIIKGKSIDQFKPLDALTRQEMCVMIVRALNSAGIPSYEKKTGFQKQYVDIDQIASWALEAVESMNAHKIINGSGEFLSPTGHLTGEQSIIMMYRAFAAFSNQEISSEDDFVIEDGVLTKCIGIGDVIIPNTVTAIDEDVFYSFEGLTSVTIPGSVKEIPSQAFRYCPDLESVTFLEGVNVLGDWSFAECSKLKKVVLPSSIQDINEGTFNNCVSLSEITFNEGLKNIGDTAFRDVALSEITFPSTLESIGSEAFYITKQLTKITFKNDSTLIGEEAFSEGNEDITFYCSANSTAESYALEYGIKTEIE